MSVLPVVQGVLPPCGMQNESLPGIIGSINFVLAKPAGRLDWSASTNHPIRRSLGWRRSSDDRRGAGSLNRTCPGRHPDPEGINTLEHFTGPRPPGW